MSENTRLVRLYENFRKITAWLQRDRLLVFIPLLSQLTNIQKSASESQTLLTCDNSFNINLLRSRLTFAERSSG